MAPSDAQRKATAARRAQAVALRDAGAEWQQIADALGYANRAAACKDVARALAEQQGMSAEVRREQEIRRLDRIQRGLWTEAIGGNLEAADVALRIIDRRQKLAAPDVTTIAAGGDRRRALEGIRDYVAAELGRAAGRDVAVLARELRDVIRELDALPSAERVTPLDKLAGAVEDELAQRRADRGAAATGT